MKPFDLEKAKAGAPVVTRGGVSARVICFDINDKSYPIAVAIGRCDGGERIASFTLDGKYYAEEQAQHENDLVMATIKKTYYVGIYRGEHGHILSTFASEFLEDIKFFAAPHELLHIASFEVEE